MSPKKRTRNPVPIPPAEPTDPTPQPPHVVANSPSDGATGVDPASNMTVTFDTDMDPVTITTPDNIRLRDATLAILPSAVTYNAATKTATLNPNSNLTTGASYTILVRTLCKSLAGLPLEVGYVFGFTAAASAPATIVGYGDTVTGGAGGPTSSVTTWAGLNSALALSRPRIIELSGAANFDGGGAVADVEGDDLTIRSAAGWTGSIKKGWFKVKGPASNILFQDLRVRPGDQVAGPDDVDAISLNAADGDIDGVCVLRCSLMWGPDIGGMSMITKMASDGGVGEVKNVTVQQTILGPGLSLSAHSEGTVALNGHAKACNVTDIANAGDVGDIATISPRPNRITFYQCLFMGAEERTPQIHYADHVDLVDSITYDWRQKGLDGNPNSINVVGHIAKAGPNLSGTGRVFYYNPNPGNNDKANSIYLADMRAIGFTVSDTIPAGVKSGTILNGGLYHVTAPATGESTATRLQRILAAVGPATRDVVDNDLLSKVAAGQSVWFNGAGKPAPNPYWPDPV